MERLITREPAWRAEQDAARLEHLMTRLEPTEIRLAALLRREQARHATRLEQARQQLERARARSIPLRRPRE